MSNCEIRSWRQLPPEQKVRLIQGLDERQLMWAAFNTQGWWTKARDNQLPPDSEWTYWLILAGRGFGKTRAGAEWTRAKIEAGCKRFALVAKDPGEARDVMVEGESGILAVSPPWFRPNYEPSKKRLTWPNGAMATVYSSEEYEELRGPQHDGAWVDEIAKFRYGQETWDNLLFGLRLGDPQICITTTPRPTKLLKSIMRDPLTTVTRGSTYENLSNLSKVYQTIIGKYKGTRLGRQELEAEVLDDNPGALWSWKMIEDHRRAELPCDAARIVIGVDPQADEEGAETGVIAVAKGVDGHYYVLGDYTVRGRPEVWGREVVRAYQAREADRVVVEVNNGGDMVTYTIKSIDRTIPVREVRASRGKLTRAEPVSALYEQGLVHHVGTFPDLEDQMTTYQPPLPGEPQRPSPDRMDALVWAITDLMEKGAGNMKEALIFGERLTSAGYDGDFLRGGQSSAIGDLML